MSQNLVTNLPPLPTQASLDKELKDYVPTALLPYLDKIPLELLVMTEGELCNKVYGKTSKGETETARRRRETKKNDDQLRRAFWNEYDRAVATNRRMAAHAVYACIIHSDNFYRMVCADPLRLSWIICPPGDYIARVTDILMITLDRFEEIANLPITTRPCRCTYGCRCKQPDGSCACKQSQGCLCPEKHDARIADVIQKVSAQLELRAKGSIIQKIDERRLQVNLQGKVPERLPPPPSDDMATIEKRIAELEQATNTPPSEQQEQLSPMAQMFSETLTEMAGYHEGQLQIARDACKETNTPPSEQQAQLTPTQQMLTTLNQMADYQDTILVAEFSEAPSPMDTPPKDV